MEKKTKLICSLGPSSKEEKVIEEMARAGMDVARINFSHGDYEEHRALFEAVKRVSDRLKKPIALMQDLPGPKIRIGEIRDGKAYLKPGSEFVLTTEELVGDSEKATVSYRDLPEKVEPGHRILLADGTIMLRVLKVEGPRVHCRVVVGGVLRPHKGVNLPDTRLGLPAITEEDRKHLSFGMKLGFDMVAVSFVKDGSDMELARELTRRRAFLLAKIERREAVENLDEVIRASDGVIVARGDLGAEMPLESVPMIQKEIISKCNALAKPVVTATQMLESMIANPYPTRAEVADVANAIIDGSDALMLSDETSIGKYPVEATRVITKIAREVESKLPYGEMVEKRRGTSPRDIISHSACQIALNLNVAAIVAPTRSGASARIVSKYRPKVPVIALTNSERVVRELTISWGVFPFKIGKYKTIDEVIMKADRIILREGLAKKGDYIVVVTGDPREPRGVTDVLKIHKLGFRL
ncbi:MAG: pyruvate kinase [Thaumarchaeota archaeon]|nr:pyruvate kinase [Nitrososphaerota archaeon]